MGRLHWKKNMLVFVCVVLLVQSVAGGTISFPCSFETMLISGDDFDPLVDLVVTVDVLKIRALDSMDRRNDADFFVELTVNDKVFVSPVWSNKDLFDDVWSVSVDVCDETRFVDIGISLYEKDVFGSEVCDIGDGADTAVEIRYDIVTGRWSGDDSLFGDPSGYGRVCGCSDGSIYEDENDAELFFRISQNDFDYDGLPYMVETEVYGTDPLVDDHGTDVDGDGLPIEWEHFWGFNPLVWEDHKRLDPDEDSLSNEEEYRMRTMGADPFRRDVFLELDFMMKSPNGVSSVVPGEALELLKLPFHRRNIMFFIDTGVMDGGCPIPYDESVDFSELLDLYNKFFLDENPTHWKRGVFHYGLIVYNCFPPGYGFSGDVKPHTGYIPGTNGFMISSAQMEENAQRSVSKSLSYFYGSAIMHEMGHNFGMRWGNPFGCDAQRSKYPWQLGYYVYRSYQSIMNYRYTYKIFDYSDGSHGLLDHDDWEALDFSYFEIPDS